MRSSTTPTDTTERRDRGDHVLGDRPSASDHEGRRVVVGATFAQHHLVDLDDAAVPVPDPDRIVHLQLRRFAGCPVCHLHLRSFVARHAELTEAGVHEVVVFHSSVGDLRPHAGDLPFPVIADPDKVLYRELGVEAAKRSILSPRVWPTIVRALAASTWAVIRRRGSAPSLNPAGGRYGLPADLLIASDGTVLAAKYGDHADDQWSVDDVLARVARAADLAT